MMKLKLLFVTLLATSISAQDPLTVIETKTNWRPKSSQNNENSFVELQIQRQNGDICYTGPVSQV